MIKALADTNILVSASFWKGNPYEIIQLAGKGKIYLFTSIGILEEYASVLKRDFKLPEEDIFKRVNIFLELLTLVGPKAHIKVITEDPDDNKVLEAAAEAKAKYIISGDKHLLNLKEFGLIKIVTARQFLDLVK